MEEKRKERKVQKELEKKEGLTKEQVLSRLEENLKILEELEKMYDAEQAEREKNIEEENAKKQQQIAENKSEENSQQNNNSTNVAPTNNNESSNISNQPKK